MAQINGYDTSSSNPICVSFYFTNQDNFVIFNNWVIEHNLPLVLPLWGRDSDGDARISYILLRNLSDFETIQIESMLELLHD
jgi:hypothetical protein